MDLIGRINSLLDVIPRRDIRIGARVLSPYPLCAAAGFALGTLCLLFLVGLLGRPLVLALAWPPLVVATFLVAGLLRRAIRGDESHALLEVWLGSFAVITAVLLATGAEVLAWLDLLAVAASAGVVLGRLGCASHGCCYGIRAEIGIWYPEWAPGGAGRRLPVQLVDAGLWLVLALAGTALLLTAPPGRAFALIFVTYGAARFVLEGLREERRHWLGLTSARWFSLLTLAIGVAVDLHRQPLSRSSAVLLGIAALLAVGLLAGHSRWLDVPALLGREARQALYDFGVRLRHTLPAPQVEQLQLGPYRAAAATWVRQEGRTWLLVSLQGGGEQLEDEMARVAFAEIVAGLGVHGEPEIHANAAGGRSIQLLLGEDLRQPSAGTGTAA